jgi:stearoyl-CoA desaturase (Delta-9 desaturase)
VLPAQRPVKGFAARAANSDVVKPKSAKELGEGRVILLAVLLVPALGAIAAVAYTAAHGISALDAALFIATYAVSGLGISVGYHRLFSHRTFQCGPVVRALAGIAGAMAIQGPVIRWAADHRRHHQFADTDLDPHSAHSGGRSIAAGLWHAHVGWVFDANRTVISKFAPDLLEDRVAKFVDRNYFVWFALSFAIPTVIGGLATQSLSGALSAFLIGGCARVFFTHNVTWIVNSVGHVWGTRPFRSKDQASNNVLFALLTFGEGWHNNHHAFPYSAQIGIDAHQFDFGFMVLRGAEAVGLVSNVRRPTKEQVAERRQVRVEVSR